jgi:hypothetical protein
MIREAKKQYIIKLQNSSQGGSGATSGRSGSESMLDTDENSY